MSTSRDAFLRRVRQALNAGNRAGMAPEIQPRGRIGYQGAGADPVARFREEFCAAGGQPHLVPDAQAVVGKVLELVQAQAPRRVLLGRGPFLDTLNLAERLRPLGFEMRVVDALAADDRRDAFFAAEAGISGVHYLVAET